MERFKVIRYVATNPADKGIEIATISTTEPTYTYIDDNVLAGIYYRYEVILYKECNDTYEASQPVLEDLGFAQSLGTVSGRVTYGSGQPVKDVNVSVVRNDLQGNETQYRSLRSKRAGTYFSWKPEASYYYNIVSNAFTYQFWLYPDASMTGSTVKKVGEIGNRLTIFVLPDAATGKYAIRIGSYPTGATTYLTTTAKISPSRFSHVTIVRNGTNLACYVVNDEDLANIQLQKTETTRDLSTSTSTNNIGIRMGYNFKGNIDECRLWSRALTPEEILDSYSRMLVGNEADLKAYWTFDEGLEGHFFDISRIGTVFNGNHGTSNLESDTIIPTRHQLSLKGVTDKNGNYQIRGIPFSGEGTSYDIVPTLGVHKFNPESHLRYVCNTSLVHNGTDFIDISSFDVKGIVTYEGGNYPVTGCNFEIDGKMVVNADGTPYTNNHDGSYSISVPIGEHTVRVVKTGHTFANNGYLDMPEGGYNSNLAEKDFHDLTRVKLIGRVVGGLTEHNKPLGFGESVNNTGASTITLTAARKDQYELSSGGDSKIFYHNDGEWKKPGSLENDSTEVTYKKDGIDIKISPATGEFVAWVYPEVYNIGTITAPGYLENIYSGGESIDLTSTPVPNDDMLQTSVRTWPDSVLIQRPGQIDYYEDIERSDTVRYHAQWTTYYQAVPTFKVKQLVDNQPVDYFGELEYDYEDALTGFKETITLWNGNSYLFGNLPLFKQGNNYTFAFEAYEEYKNENTNKTHPYSVDQGTVIMSNSIALNDPEPIVLDETGKATYTFTAGAPDLTTAQNSFLGTIAIGKATYHWNLGKDPIKAWHLGDRTTG
ncbi:LamG domain-containing protein, partial [Bacteroidales bacterium OttesenSCG-928-L03]|nr:LamG domain-containing protein [Bacteroidales bacterium OttesenSCG-928-L03]